LGWHLTPDQEHQTGSKAGVGSQSWKVERGSLRADFRDRRESS